MDLKNKFKEEAGIPWKNSQGEPDIDYVDWLEKKIEFLSSCVDVSDEQWEMFNTPAEELVGKKVISIRAGFSNHGGQVMLVSNVENGVIHLMPCEESANKNSRGWISSVDNKHKNFTLYHE